jgi:hypothetical protein
MDEDIIYKDIVSLLKIEISSSVIFRDGFSLEN